MCNNTHDSGVERGISTLIEKLARLLTDRVFYQVTDQVSDDATEARKKERLRSLKAYVKSIPLCPARDLIEREFPELFTDDNL